MQPGFPALPLTTQQYSMPRACPLRPLLCLQSLSVNPETLVTELLCSTPETQTQPASGLVAPATEALSPETAWTTYCSGLDELVSAVPCVTLHPYCRGPGHLCSAALP